MRRIDLLPPCRRPNANYVQLVTPYSMRRAFTARSNGANPVHNAHILYHSAAMKLFMHVSGSHQFMLLHIAKNETHTLLQAMECFSPLHPSITLQLRVPRFHGYGVPLQRYVPVLLRNTDAAVAW